MSPASMPAFEFAVKLREGPFRAALALAGWAQGTTIIVLPAGTGWDYALELADGADWPVMVAREAPHVVFGWEFKLLEPVDREAPR